jgi:hypothetical protein
LADIDSIHPARRPEIERLLDEYHVQWEFDPSLPLSEIDEKRSYANQARVDQPIDPELVTTYTESRKQGDVFPAIVVHKDGKLFVNVDGNHRYASAKAAGEATHAAYKIVAKGETIRVLMTLLNVIHGRALPEKERLWHAFYLMDAGTDATRAAAVLHLPLPRLRSAWALEQANRRARDVGVSMPKWKELTQTIRMRLAAVSTDAAFKRLFDLTVKAGLKSDEVNRMVTEINKLRSEQAQVDFVETEAEAIRSRIQESAGGVIKRTQSPKHALRMHLGAVAKINLDTIPGLVTDQEGTQIAEVCVAAAEALMKLADKLTAGVQSAGVQSA